MSALSRDQQATLGGGGAGPFGMLRRALRLLEAVDRRPGGVTTGELARDLSVPPPSVQRLAEELEIEGYLTFADGAWVLGGAFALLGRQSREPLVRARMQHRLAELRDEIGAAVYFSRYHDGELTVEAVSTADHAPAVEEWVDFRATAHASAIGKCLLSQLDHEGRLDHLARHPVARLTSRTITDPEQLMHRLERQPPPSRCWTCRSTRSARSAPPSRSPPAPRSAAWPPRCRSPKCTGCARRPRCWPPGRRR